jgi:two-component system sensor histidine kinase/response regulator
MTRDLVTPMQSLQLLVEEGKQMTAKSDAMSKYLQSVERACNRLTTLGEDIVENLRLETGQLEIVYRKFNLTDMLKAVEDVVAPQAQSASLMFAVQLVQPLQAYYVGDIGRLRQILMKLLSNSLKCTPAGGHVIMEVEEETRDGNDSFLKFVIRDEGTGLSDVFMEQLFYSFRQKHLVSTAQMQEAGRGIFEAYNLVQLMGGTLDVGKYEKGNESIVRIPLKEPWTMMLS